MRPLTSAEIRRVAAETHAIWGEGRSVEDHAAAVEEQIARAAGMLDYVGLVDSDRVIASLKRYRVALEPRRGADATEPLGAVAIGAVFTSPAERRHGHAARLVRAVLEEAARAGAAAAYLFSDIDPAYYGRLGFRAGPALTWSAAVAELPRAGAFDLREGNDVDAVARIHRETWRGARARPARDERAWRFFLWRNGPLATRLLLRQGEAVGYALVARTGDTLWLADVAAPREERRRLWASLRPMAERAACTRVAGWLSDELTDDGPFTPSARRGCIPMLALLEPAHAEALHDPFFASLDRL